MSRNPRTDAGREMLDKHGYWGEWYQHNWLVAILAIEDEAAATERRLTVERAAQIVASHGWGHAMPMTHEDWRDGESAFDHINRHLDDLATADVDEEAWK